MSTAVLSVDSALKQIDEAVEKIMNDAPQNFPIAATVGDAVRQGDVYIQLIDPITATPALYREVKNVQYPVQLAPGNTKGSRHCLEQSESAKVYMPMTQMLEDIAGRDIAEDRSSREQFFAARAKAEEELAAAKENDDAELVSFLNNIYFWFIIMFLHVELWIDQ